MRNLSFIIALLLVITLQQANGEIEHLIIRWTAMECQGFCMAQIDREYKKVPGVEEISVIPGEAVIKWRKNVPFSLTTIKNTMRLVGLYMRDLRIRVRGKIRHDALTVSLISLGDNTPFLLLNPVVPDMARQAPQYNLAARNLTPDLRERFLEAEANQQVVTVEGPIFMPERSPPDPLAIISDYITFANPTPNEQPGSKK